MKLVCISDTHNQHSSVTLPGGDILVHAGDFTSRGRPEEVAAFLAWLNEAGKKFRHVVLCAGNHDWLFDSSPSVARQMLHEHAPDVIYLQDQQREIDGLLFYASPHTPWFYDWAFNVHRGADIRRYWKLIPEETDILITHGPPFGIGDQAVPGGRHLGCEELRHRLESLSVRAHIFGHIHGGYGVTASGETLYVNAAVCDEQYRPVNAPIVLEVEPSMRAGRSVSGSMAGGIERG